MQNPKIKVFISAAEVSSDLHGAALLRALKQSQKGCDIEAFGLGGAKLKEAGLDVRWNASEFLAMGISEVFKVIPRVLKLQKKMVRSIEQERPHAVVLIDYPDFHFRLAKKLNRLGIPLIYYIPPKVWVWRKHRLKFLKKFFSKILVIFPFEEDFYRENQVPATYVGNPLVAELPLKLTQSEAKAKLGLSSEESVIVAMPGSRPAELENHLELMLDAIRIASEKLGKTWTVLIPIPWTAKIEVIETRVADWKKNKAPIKIQVYQGESAICLAAADYGLIKSGTSTLEAGLLGCPHVVVYRSSRLTTWVFNHIVRFDGPVGLSNLVVSRKREGQWIPEFINENATSENLSHEIVRYFSEIHGPAQEKFKRGFALLRQNLGVDSHGNREWIPSQRAAEAVLQVIQEVKK